MISLPISRIPQCAKQSNHLVWCFYLFSRKSLSASTNDVTQFILYFYLLPHCHSFGTKEYILSSQNPDLPPPPPAALPPPQDRDINHRRHFVPKQIAIKTDTFFTTKKTKLRPIRIILILIWFEYIKDLA